MKIVLMLLKILHFLFISFISFSLSLFLCRLCAHLGSMFVFHCLSAHTIPHSRGKKKLNRITTILNVNIKRSVSHFILHLTSLELAQENGKNVRWIVRVCWIRKQYNLVIKKKKIVQQLNYLVKFRSIRLITRPLCVCVYAIMKYLRQWSAFTHTRTPDNWSHKYKQSCTAPFHTIVAVIQHFIAKSVLAN